MHSERSKTRILFFPLVTICAFKSPSHWQFIKFIKTFRATPFNIHVRFSYYLHIIEGFWLDYSWSHWIWNLSCNYRCWYILFCFLFFNDELIFIFCCVVAINSVNILFIKLFDLSCIIPVFLMSFYASLVDIPIHQQSC